MSTGVSCVWIFHLVMYVVWWKSVFNDEFAGVRKMFALGHMEDGDRK